MAVGHDQMVLQPLGTQLKNYELLLYDQGE